MKRIITLLASLALVASGLHILPAAAAEEAPEIPEVVQVDDPLGDANGLNDQDTAGTPLDGQGDNVGPAGGNATDLLKIWFSNTATDVSLHFQTNGDPGGLAYDTYYRFGTNPGTGPVAANEARGCLYWIASINGAAGGYTGETGAALEDQCNVGERIDGTLTTTPGPETTFITTMTFPRSYSPLLADAGSITAPYGISRVVYVGPLPQAGTAAVVTLDTTKRGTDYLMVAGTPAKKTPPGKNNPPGKKKGCTKGKGKKRGCEGKGKKSPKPGKPSAKCAPFTPGEAGKDKPLVVLTDAATEEKPVEQTISVDASLANLRLHSAIPAAGPLAATADAFNIQVDSAAKEAGLYALIEFAPRRDYDLNLLHADGSYAARARSFNTAVETPFSVPGHGGEGTDHSEKLVGIKTGDCGGWTLSAENHFGEGGDFAVKLWLGPVTNDPQEAGAEVPAE